MRGKTDQPAVPTVALIQARLGGLWGSLTAVGEWLTYAEAWQAVWGTSSPLPLPEQLHPADRVRWRTAVRHSQQNTQPHTFEARLRHPDGQYHWYQWRIAPLPSQTETPQFALQAWHIQHIRQPYISTKQTLLQAILETSIGAIIVLNTAGQITFANQRAQEVLGLTRRELTQRTYDDPLWKPTTLDGQPWPDEKQPFRIVMETGEAVYNIRHAIEWPNGQRKALSINGAPLKDGHGQLTGAVFLVHDITQQLQTERTLHESESLFRGIVESQIDLVSRYKPDTTLLYVNEAYCNYFGYAREEIIGKSFLSMVANTEKELVNQRLAELRVNPAPRTLIMRDKAPDGRDRWVQWTDYGLLDENGNLYMVQAVGREVTEMKQLEIALRQSQQRLETLIANLPGLVYRCQNTPEWSVTYISDGVLDILGYTADEFLHGRVQVGDLIEPEWRQYVYQEVQKAIAEQRPFELTYQVRHKDGGLRWMWERGRLMLEPESPRDTAVLEGFITDITEQKRAEEVLLQTQKAESLGVLAGGIAHDFNNLLVAILGQSSLALSRLDEEAAAYKPIGKVVKAAKRASDLTRQLLAYSGQGQFQVQPLDVNDLLQESTHLLQVAVSHRVELVLDLWADLPLILADAGQIQQIAMNLVLNAAEAIEDSHGVVRIHTAVCDIEPDKPYQSRWMEHPLTSGRFVKIQVQDNGIGMNKETINRIFDPFFSTKFTGRGLGLSAVAGIVNSHRGGIDVTSTPGQGTTFTLFFPALDNPAADLLPASQTDRPQQNLHQQLSGTILLIDDEELVREAVRDMLTETKLAVLEAPNGMAGLELFVAHHKQIGLVLLDISMPQMSGLETMRRIREIDPTVPIVLSSGYQNITSDRLADDITTEISDFIQKPYQPQRLYNVLAQFLAAPAPRK